MQKPGLTLSFLFLMTGAASSPSVAIPPPIFAPPPIFDGPGANVKQNLLSWTAGEARCDGRAVAAVTIQRPQVQMHYVSARTRMQQDYRFRLDAQGRPLSITPDQRSRVGQSIGDDLGAALAASRFAPGPARADCRISYEGENVPVDEAPPEMLMAFSVGPQSSRLLASAWRRMATTGSTCMDMPRPEPRLRAFPDFHALPATPGARDWSMIGYDLDRGGKPVRIHTVNGTGNRALDGAAQKAVAQSRFAGGARSGCLYPYWRTPATLAAPDRPSAQSLAPAGGNCTDDSNWAVPPRLIYPTVYRQRAIEGWAAIAYDVAPWGEIGNVRVLASEPTVAFGQQALQMLRMARKPASPSGATGCVSMVRFEIGKAGDATDMETLAFME